MTRRGAAIPLLLATGLLCAAAPLLADQVTSKGTVLKGKVTGLSSGGLVFEPEYGKGVLTIDWKDVEDVKTETPFQVLYGDDLELDAPLQGFSDGKVLVGGDPTTATAIPTADLHSAIALGPDGLTWQDKTRSYFRYWDGSLDLGLNLQQATTDTFGFLIGMNTTRTKGPTRLIFAANYRYSTQEKRGDSKSTTIEDRAFGSMRGEYSFTERFYGYGSGDATYDAIQKLSIRGIPKAGLGYLFWEEKLDETKREAPIAFHGGLLQAASFRYIQRCMVARLRCGANRLISRALSSASGRCGRLCSRCSAVASALSPTGAASANPARIRT